MKQVIIKVYHPTGEFIKVWKNAKFVGFTKQLNSGLGSCTIELGEKMDYAGVDLELNNEVQIWISDKDTKDTTGKLIYSGYISNYALWARGKREGIEVHLLGYYTKLALDIWRNSATKTTTFSYTVDTDFGQMFRDLMTRYIAETPSSKLNWSTESIKLTGSLGQYLFEMKTYREAIENILSMSPVGWFWYVDEINQVHFKTKPTTPKHTFVLGKHFSKVRVIRNMEKIRNSLLFWNREISPAPQIYKWYEDVVSVSRYGRRTEKYFDYAVSQVATADKIAAHFLGEVKEPEVRAIVEIVDNNEDPVSGYDIESISPGDTCSIRGFDESISDIFEANMLITKVVYSLNKIEVTIEVREAGIVKWQAEQNRKIADIFSERAPTTYT